MTSAVPGARRSILTRFRTCLPVGVLLGALCLTWAGSAAHANASSPPAPVGSIGLRLVDAPVEARDDPRAKIYIVDHLAPGQVINRRVEVSNGTASALRVALYPAAASIVDGQFLGAQGRTANDLSSWTTVTPSSPEIPPGGAVMATVTIAVPSDAASGEQYGAVWVEASSPPAGGTGVTQVSRVGLRLYVDVGPGGAPAADFSIDTLTAARDEAGHPAVHATVHNLGGRALDMTGTLMLANGPGGTSAGPFDAAAAGITLGVGDTGAVEVVMDDELPAGPWDAVVTLRSGRVEKSAQGTITFPVTGRAAAVDTTTAIPRWLLSAGAGLALLALASGAATWSRRRRRNQLDPDGAASPHRPQSVGAHGARFGRAGAHRATSAGRSA